MAFIDNPWFYVFAGIAVLIAGVSKASMGTGFAGLAVPIMALTIPANQAAAIMLPVLLAIDAMTLYAFRGKFDRQLLWQIVPGGLLGTLIGTLLFKYVNADSLRLFIGIEAIVFAIYRIALAKRLERAPPTQRSLPKALVWSTFSGFTSFIAHAGGPPLQQYLVPLKLDKVMFVGTTTIFFATMNFSKVVPYSWLGLLNFQNVGTSLLLFPLVPIGTYLGLNVLKRLDQKAFTTVMNYALLVVGVKLCFDSLR